MRKNQDPHLRYGRKLVLRKRIELVALGILIIGIIGYAGSGIAYSGVLAASAERTINTVVSHQNSLNQSFTSINSELSALSTSSTFNAQQAITLVDKSVSNSELATRTINEDDASLSSVEGQLAGNRWLTAIARTNVDRESTRVAHARDALAAARTIASDQVLDGRFWHSLYTALGDLDALNKQSGGGDLTSARATLNRMQTDVNMAVQQSTSPGLPADLHDLMVDLQSFVTDYGKQLDAQLAGDDASVAQYQAGVEADLTKLGAYDIDKIGKEIDSFYKPLIVRFNSQIAAATA
jgi:hypothetical protein